MVAQLEDFTSAMSEDDVRQFASDYFIPFDVHPEAPDVDVCIADFPDGKIGLYTRFFDYANYRIPISMFLSNLLNYYQLHISQLNCLGAAKISNFEINCRLLAITPTVDLFLPFNMLEWVGYLCQAPRAPAVLHG